MLSRFPVYFARVSESIDFEEIRRRQPEVAGLGLRKSTIVNGLHHVKLHGRDLPVVPPSLVPQLLSNIHQTFNHCGVKKMVQLVAHRFWFPSRDQLIHSFVKSCHVCQMTKAPNQSMLRPTHPIATPDQPMKVWACEEHVLGKEHSGGRRFALKICLGQGNQSANKGSAHFLHVSAL